MQHRLFAGLTAAALSLGLTVAAHAQGTIVRNDGRQVYTTPTGQGAYDDGLLPLYANANQHVGLAKNVEGSAALVANYQPSFIDPQAQYLQRRPGRIDQNHSMLRAQRLYNALHSTPTRVIRKAPVVVRVVTVEAEPVMILMKPDGLRPRQQKDVNSPVNVPAIPNVPRNDKPESDGSELMALAD